MPREKEENKQLLLKARVFSLAHLTVPGLMRYGLFIR